ALRVVARRELWRAGVLDLPAQLGDLGLLVLRDDVERLVVLLGVDAHARPGAALLLLLRAPPGCPPGQVAHVADRGLDHEVLAQELGDGLGLRGRFDDHERLAHLPQRNAMRGIPVQTGLLRPPPLRRRAGTPEGY